MTYTADTAPNHLRQFANVRLSYFCPEYNIPVPPDTDLNEVEAAVKAAWVEPKRMPDCDLSAKTAREIVISDFPDLARLLRG